MATDNALVHESPEDLALRLLQLYALPDRESPERKNAFKDLIELTRIGASPLKIVAAQQIPRFLDDFPDLEEDAINAVYDLCEDSLTEVRVEGYKAIVSVSRKNRKWGKRNVDVLVQLLQIDQESEVLVVKTALGEHLQIDTRTTLSVLCDQLIVPSQEPADEDEKSTRERLRALVLSYLVNDAKAHILDACKQTQLSRDIVDALKPSIPNFDLQDLFTLLQKLVFFLPGYMLKDEGTTDLFSSLIEAATKHTEPPNLGSTRPFLELLCSIATTGDFVRMGSFLDFLLTVFLHENRLEAYVPEDRIYILGVFGDTLAAFRPQGHAEAKIATWNVCPYVIEHLDNLVQDKTQGKALKSVLNFCMECIRDRPEEVPRSESFLASMRKIAANDELKHLQHIARYLVDARTQRAVRPFKPRQPSTSISAPTMTQKTPQPNAKIPPIFQSNNGMPPPPHPQQRQQRNSFSNLPNRPPAQPVRQASGELPRPQKRARTDDDMEQGPDRPPSLLTRMMMPAQPHSAPSTPNPSSQRVFNGRGAPPRPDPPRAQNDAFSGGLSIKGAAARQAEVVRPAPARTVSLLERLADAGGGSAPRGGGRGGRRGKRGHL